MHVTDWYTRQRDLLSNHGSSSEVFVGNLRETLLQDPSELADENPLIAEVVSQLCFELAYNTISPCHATGYATLHNIYRMAHGSHSIQSLGQTSHLIDDLATTTFSK